MPWVRSCGWWFMLHRVMDARGKLGEHAGSWENTREVGRARGEVGRARGELEEHAGKLGEHAGVGRARGKLGEQEKSVYYIVTDIIT